jgi:hypothetical protein
MKFFTPEALAVATTAKAFAEELHYSDVGREHLLLGFAGGAAGAIVGSAFGRSGLTVDAVRSAITFIDGPMRPVRPHHVKYVHEVHGKDVPYTVGVRSLIAAQLFVGLTPNADRVFRMARDESIAQEVAAEDVLLIFLREIGRNDDERRVMQVIHQAVPGLGVDDIKSAMVVSLDAAIDEMEEKHGKVIVVVRSNLNEDQQEIVRLKRLRHAFMYTGRLQEA